MKQVRFIQSWQNYRVGDVIEPPGTLRQWLLETKRVELCDQPPAVPVAIVESAALAPTENTMRERPAPRRRAARTA